MKRFNVVHAGKPAHSPHHFEPIIYGPKIQLITHDDTPAFTPPEAKFIREVNGMFLYYAHAVDSTMLTPLSNLATG